MLLLTYSIQYVVYSLLISVSVTAKRKCEHKSTSSLAKPAEASVPAYNSPAPSGNAASFPSPPRKVTLLHTNDIHAHMEEFNNNGLSCNADQIAKNKCFGGVARIKTVVDAFRANTSDLILLDAGDQFQGTLFFNFYGGNVSSQVMNILKYDAMTIGNHEFDNGVEVLSSFIKSLNFPVISSNIDINQENLTVPLRDAGVKPFIILPKYRLGVIGFITNMTASLIAGGERFKNSILDPVETVQKYVDELHAQGIHRIICLSHNGYKDDVYLAQNVKGVQLIVGGHSHSYLSNNASDPRTEGPYPTRALNSLDGKPVYVVQAHRYGDYLGHLELEWDEKDNLVS
jgi:2',3'-cyclic-nucleotide 2'-phosphodiesterase (5'-nucleotidase family)